MNRKAVIGLVTLSTFNSDYNVLIFANENVISDSNKNHFIFS